MNSMSSASPSPSHVDGAQDVGRLGVWFFILTEVMLFGAFVAAVIALRWKNVDCGLGVSAWPAANQTGGLLLATLNTVVLLTSSYTMVRAVLAGHASDKSGLRRFLGWTMVLGAAFLIIKSIEYTLKIHHGYVPNSPLFESTPGMNIFLSAYFVMTGLHGLHVFAGLIWNGLLWRSVMTTTAPATLGRKVEYAGLYWHFVDVVWVFLYPLFYLV